MTPLALRLRKWRAKHASEENRQKEALRKREAYARMTPEQRAKKLTYCATTEFSEGSRNKAQTSVRLVLQEQGSQQRTEKRLGSGELGKNQS